MLIPRTITKTQFKKLWEMWRSLDPAGRINELSCNEWSLGWRTFRSKFIRDALLVKHRERALKFEQAKFDFQEVASC